VGELTSVHRSGTSAGTSLMLHAYRLPRVPAPDAELHASCMHTCFATTFGTTRQFALCIRARYMLRQPAGTMSVVIEQQCHIRCHRQTDRTCVEPVPHVVAAQIKAACRAAHSRFPAHQIASRRRLITINLPDHAPRPYTGSKRMLPSSGVAVVCGAVQRMCVVLECNGVACARAACAAVQQRQCPDVLSGSFATRQQS